MKKEYDMVVLIGRFQPLHRAHVELIRRAAELGERVSIIVGSSYLPRTYKNPWTFDERLAMIEAEIKALDLDRGCFFISPMRDYNDDTAWAAAVQAEIENNIWAADIAFDQKIKNIAIIGHSKDESSYYLKMFQQWDLVDIPLIEPLSATDIRELYFKDKVNMSYLSTVLPKSTWKFLNGFAITKEHAQIVREREHIETYRLQYKHLPYEPVFVTVDAVVIQSGHVLLIKRRSEPGKGLWALPGGFLNAGTDRSIEDACIRELREETKIKVPDPALRGSIKDTKVFDKINRSARGRTITHAHKIILQDGPLPKVVGSDDAEKAVWIPLASVRSEEIFEDHYNIIQWAKGS